MSDRIYLDYNATAKIRPEVIEALATTLGHVGNASSVHESGRAARKLIETARQQVGKLVGANPNQIVFTSGGTEADNQVMRACNPNRTLVSAIEHPAVLDSCPPPRIRTSALSMVRTTSAPVPWGPPNLCPVRAMVSTFNAPKCTGIFPTACTASQ